MLTRNSQNLSDYYINDDNDTIMEDFAEWKIVSDTPASVMNSNDITNHIVDIDDDDDDDDFEGAGVLIVPPGEGGQTLDEATQKSDVVPMFDIDSHVVIARESSSGSDEDDSLTIPDTDSLPTTLESILRKAAPSNECKDEGEDNHHCHENDDDVSQLSNTNYTRRSHSQGFSTTAADMLPLESLYFPLKTWGLWLALIMALSYIGYLHSVDRRQHEAALWKSHLQMELKQWQQEMAAALLASQQSKPEKQGSSNDDVNKQHVAELSLQEIQEYIEQAVQQAQEGASKNATSHQVQVINEVAQECKRDLVQQIEAENANYNSPNSNVPSRYYDDDRSKGSKTALNVVSTPVLEQIPSPFIVQEFEDIPVKIPTKVHRPMVIEYENLQETYVPPKQNNNVGADTDDTNKADPEKVDEGFDQFMESKGRKLAQTLGSHLSAAHENFWSAVEWNADNLFDEAGDYAGESWSHANAKIRQTATESFLNAQKWTRNSLERAKKSIVKAHEKIMETDKSLVRVNMEETEKKTKHHIDLKGVATVAGGVIFVSLATLATSFLTSDDSYDIDD